MRAVVDCRMPGKPKTCQIVREVDQWFAVCTYETEDGVSKPAATGGPVAIDRGVTNLLADSDGRLVLNPRHMERAAKRLKRAQRALTRKTKGSSNRKKAMVRFLCVVCGHSAHADVNAAQNLLVRYSRRSTGSAACGAMPSRRASKQEVPHIECG